MKTSDREKTARRVWGVVLAAALLIGALPIQTQAASSADIQKEINALEEKNAAIQKEIDGIQRQYNANYSNMEDIVAQKSSIDQEMTLLSDKIVSTNEQIAAYGQLIADAQEELDSAKTELRELSEANQLRVRAMEEGGTVSYWEVIFKASSFTDLLDRINMVDEIAAGSSRCALPRIWSTPPRRAWKPKRSIWKASGRN